MDFYNSWNLGNKFVNIGFGEFESKTKFLTFKNVEKHILFSQLDFYINGNINF